MDKNLKYYCFKYLCDEQTQLHILKPSIPYSTLLQIQKFISPIEKSVPQYYPIRSTSNSIPFKINYLQPTQQNQQKFYLCLHYIQQWRIKKFKKPFGNWILPRVILSLGFTKFSCLKQLILYNNSIFTVESLAFIDASSLQILNLDCNFIVSLKLLAKCRFKKLRVFACQKNHIDSDTMAHLTKMYLDRNVDNSIGYIKQRPYNNPQNFQMELTFISNQINLSHFAPKYPGPRLNRILIEQNQYYKYRHIEMLQYPYTRKNTFPVLQSVNGFLFLVEQHTNIENPFETYKKMFDQQFGQRNDQHIRQIRIENGDVHLYQGKYSVEKLRFQKKYIRLIRNRFY